MVANPGITPAVAPGAMGANPAALGINVAAANLAVAPLNNAALTNEAFGNLSPQELNQVAGQLEAFLEALREPGPKGPTAASLFLRSSGAFIVQPLAEGVKVAKADDSGYWSALGYEA